MESSFWKVSSLSDLLLDPKYWGATIPWNVGWIWTNYKAL
jgi:hypothetical protein